MSLILVFSVFLLFLVAFSSATRSYPRASFVVPKVDEKDFSRWYREASRSPKWFSETDVLAVVERFLKNELPFFKTDLTILTLDYAPIYNDLDLMGTIFEQQRLCVEHHFELRPSKGGDAPHALYYLAALTQAKSALMYYESTPSGLAQAQAEEGVKRMKIHFNFLIDFASGKLHLHRSRDLICQLDVVRSTFHEVEAFTVFSDLICFLRNGRYTDTRAKHVIKTCMVHMLTRHAAQQVQMYQDDLSYNNVDWHAWLVSLAEIHGLMGPSRASMILNDLLRFGTDPAVQMGSLYFTEEHIIHLLSLLESLPSEELLHLTSKNARLMLIFLKFNFRNDNDELLGPLKALDSYDLPKDYFSQVLEYITLRDNNLATELKKYVPLFESIFSMTCLENVLCNLVVTQVFDVDKFKNDTKNKYKKVETKNSKNIIVKKPIDKGNFVQIIDVNEEYCQYENDALVCSLKKNMKKAFDKDNCMLPEECDPIAISSYLALEYFFNHKFHLNQNLSEFSVPSLEHFDCTMIENVQSILNKKMDMLSGRRYGVLLHAIRRLTIFQTSLFKQFAEEQETAVMKSHLVQIVHAQLKGNNPLVNVIAIYKFFACSWDPFLKREYGEELIDIVDKNIPFKFIKYKQALIIALRHMLSYHGADVSYMKKYENSDALDESGMTQEYVNNSEYAVISAFAALQSSSSWKWGDAKGFLSLVENSCERYALVSADLQMSFFLAVKKALSLLIKEKKDVMIEQLLGNHWSHIYIRFVINMLDPKDLEYLATLSSPRAALASRLRLISREEIRPFVESEINSTIRFFNGSGKADYGQLTAFFGMVFENLALVVNLNPLFSRKTTVIRRSVSKYFNLRIGELNTVSVPMATDLQQLRSNYVKRMDARLEMLLAVCMEITVHSLINGLTRGTATPTCIHRIDDDSFEIIDIPSSSSVDSKTLRTQTKEDAKPPEKSVEELLREISGDDVVNPPKTKNKKNLPTPKVQVGKGDTGNKAVKARAKPSDNSVQARKVNHNTKTPAKSGKEVTKSTKSVQLGKEVEDEEMVVENLVFKSKT